MTRINPLDKAKRDDEREKMIFDAATGQAFADLDSRYSQLDHTYDMAKAQLDREYAATEHRSSLLAQGRALRSGNRMSEAKNMVAEAKQREAELRAKAQGKPPPPSETLDDVYQPVNPGASAPNPTQIPVTAIGPGGPQGVQQAKAVDVGQGEGVPPWLVSGRQQTDTGTRDFGAGIFMPDTATRSTVDVQQNAQTADAAARNAALLQRAREAQQATEATARRTQAAMIVAGAITDPRMEPIARRVLESAGPDAPAILTEAQSMLGEGAFKGPRETVNRGGVPVSEPRSSTPPGTELWRRAPDTTTIQNFIPNPNAATPATMSELQAQGSSAIRSIDSLGQIARTFDPAFLTYRGKIKGTIGDIMSKAEVDLDPDEKDFRLRYGRFKNAVGTNLADTIRAATGAQMSDKEWSRYEKFMPNESMSVETFLGAWQQAMTRAMYAVARSNYLAQGGFGDAQMSKVIGQVPLFELYDKYIPLESVKSLINDRADEHAEQLKIRNPALGDREVKRQALQETFKEFGIDKFYSQGILTPGSH